MKQRKIQQKNNQCTAFLCLQLDICNEKAKHMG